MITIVNIRNNKADVYCGRGSALGNPFVMHNETQRDDVCNRYETHFNHQVRELKDEAMLKQLRMIWTLAKKGDVSLGCYCAPKRCHCDTIKAYIEEHL